MFLPGWVSLLAFSHHYRLSPLDGASSLARTAANYALAWIHDRDLEAVSKITARYWHVPEGRLLEGTLESWTSSGGPHLRGLRVTGPSMPKTLPDLVFEDPATPELARFRAVVGLDSLIAGADSDYEAAIRIAGWLGNQWDHGMDTVPGGVDPVRADRVLEAARKGGRFWCEVASKVLVELASSAGIPARLLTASKDGYTWNHGLAEVWSNAHGKWIVLDADYNQAYLDRGVPLSAWEMCHLGPELLATGRLEVLPLGMRKPSLRPNHLVWIYAYVHASRRNDWFTRALPKGSPAGGDLNTTWTKRDTLGPVWTSMVRAETRDQFEPALNACEIILLDGTLTGQEFELEIAIAAYSPYWVGNEYRVDGGPYEAAGTGPLRLTMSSGRHVIEARTVTWGGWRGPPRTLEFEVSPIPDYAGGEPTPR